MICLEWPPAVQRCHCITFSHDATRVLWQSKKLSLLLPTGWWHCISTGRHHIISAGCTYMMSCVCTCWVYTIKHHSYCNIAAARLTLFSLWPVSPFLNDATLVWTALVCLFFFKLFISAAANETTEIWSDNWLQTLLHFLVNIIIIQMPPKGSWRVTFQLSSSLKF